MAATTNNVSAQHTSCSLLLITLLAGLSVCLVLYSGVIPKWNNPSLDFHTSALCRPHY